MYIVYCQKEYSTEVYITIEEDEKEITKTMADELGFKEEDISFSRINWDMGNFAYVTEY